MAAESMSQAATITKSTEQVHEFIKDIEQAYLLECTRRIGVERRSDERMDVTMPVRVTALNDNFEPLDYQYHAVTRNMSRSGVGLVTTNPIGRSHVLLTFEPYHGEIFTVVAKVIYCKEVGYYFQIGCEFVAS